MSTPSHTIDENKHTSTNSSTGESTTTSTTTISTGDGQRLYESHSVTRTAADGGSTTTGTSTSYNDDGSHRSKTLHSETRDSEGNVTEASMTTLNEDGSTTTRTRDKDGNVTTVKKDKDDKVISEETVDAEGNPIETPKEDEGGFWDPDIIYGGPDGKMGTDDDMFIMDMEVEHFSEAHVEFMVQEVGEDTAMALVDNFEFLM